MKIKRRFFNRKFELALSGKEIILSRVSVIIVIFSGIMYTAITNYNLTNNHKHSLQLRNIGGAFILGFVISTVGVGLILTRPPNQRLFWSILFCILFFALGFVPI